GGRRGGGRGVRRRRRPAVSPRTPSAASFLPPLVGARTVKATKDPPPLPRRLSPPPVPRAMLCRGRRRGEHLYSPGKPLPHSSERDGVMAYQCPRCGAGVQRASTGFFPMGLVGALIRQAFAGFQCPRCGPIPREEFTPEEQSQMTMGSVAYV